MIMDAIDFELCLNIEVYNQELACPSHSTINMATPASPEEPSPSATTNARARRFSEATSDVSESEHYNQPCPPAKKSKISDHEPHSDLPNLALACPPPEPSRLVDDSPGHRGGVPLVDPTTTPWDSSRHLDGQDNVTFPRVHSHPNTPTTSQAPERVLPLHELHGRLCSSNLRAPRFIIYEDPQNEEAMEIDGLIGEWDFSDEDKENTNEEEGHENANSPASQADMPLSAQLDSPSHYVRQWGS